MVGGVDKQFDFDFYLLLDSYYTDNVVVGDAGDATIGINEYPKRPTLNYAEMVAGSVNDNRYVYYSSKNNEYPTLTFDYTRYKLTYTHISGDVQKKVELKYNQSTNMLDLDTTLYNSTTTVPYEIQAFGNNIVTLMFVEHGIYEFDFKYIYISKDRQDVIDEDQIDYSKSTLNMRLNIYGYQLKYSKAGFASADMTYLEICQNQTMFILVNGFTDASEKKEGSALGVQYKLIAPTSKEKTGTIHTRTSGAIILNNFPPSTSYL